MVISLKYIAFLTCFFAVSCAHAQNASEWFSQKSTQKQYLLQQIAALQVYSKYLKSGYNIAKGGLGSITGSLRLEYGLHQTYYSRLKTASPPVKNNGLVKAIMTRQQNILSKVKELNETTGLNTEEKTYIASVSAALLKDCDQQLQTLSNITGDGKIEMSDADRLSLLNKVHTAMEENYRFIAAFMVQVRLYVSGRAQEQQQATTTKRIYGLK